MPTNDPQPTIFPYRLSEQMQIDLPSLVSQERALLDLLGGPFPERNNDFDGFTRVLDVACGAGSWALEVARAHPRLEVIGLANQQVLVSSASARAAEANLKNARFLLLTGEQRPQLPFPDEYFDLVNTQYLHSWLRADEWPDFVDECWRVTRPSGSVRMTEPERGQSTSLAFTRLEDLFLQAMHKTGQCFSPDNRHIGAANQLVYLCQEAGWTEITRRAAITDYGKMGDLPEKPFSRIQLYTRTFQPLILQQGLASAEELATLMQQVGEEMESEDFAANRFLITVCGHKPGTREKLESDAQQIGATRKI
ncbi:MAG TPA: methyltransferase domain-containing protein [Ktedonobacteraceae bacterium]|nr:methyltransferase domain-containing protein [Ktedonobacteraceae bacterium]